MLRTVDRERDELEGMIQQVQDVLLSVSRNYEAFSPAEFITRVIPVIQLALNTQRMAFNPGQPPDDAWRPGADFGDIRVVIEENPFQLRYFVIPEDDSEDDLR